MTISESVQITDKVTRRRDQLAEAALKTLSELGYARTSLREIAQNSEFSHGVVHYYFADKTDLILHCVRYFKAECVTRYDHLVAGAGSAEELRKGFSDKLVETLVEETGMHRLWYDIRSQSMFEAALQPDVAEIDGNLQAMIWRVVSRYAELAQRDPSVTAPMAYALLDGLFQQALLAYARDEPDATDRLRAESFDLLPHLLG